MKKSRFGIEAAFFIGGKRGSGTKSAKHPKGRSGFWYLTPFFQPAPKLSCHKALVAVFQGQPWLPPKRLIQ